MSNLCRSKSGVIIMISIDILLKNKNNIKELSEMLSEHDIEDLIKILPEKNNEIRYLSLLVLQERSRSYPDVYKYWNTFVDKLNNNNSYQRSIGIMLISENIKWDKENQFDTIKDLFFSHFVDEKFITSRQAIQSIHNWIEYRKDLVSIIIDYLTDIDFSSYKNNQKQLLKKDADKAILFCESLI